MGSPTDMVPAGFFMNSHLESSRENAEQRLIEMRKMIRIEKKD